MVLHKVQLNFLHLSSLADTGFGSWEVLPLVLLKKRELSYVINFILLTYIISLICALHTFFFFGRNLVFQQYLEQLQS